MRLEFDLEDQRLSRPAWSRLAEPGDALAGALVQRMGPGPALRWLTDGEAPLDGLTGLDAGSVDGLRARLAPRLDGLDPRRELRALERLGGSLLIPGDRGWPAGLDDLGDRAPFCLWVRAAGGVAETLGDRLTPSAGVVGSRACTAYGENLTGRLVVDLAEHGVAVVSGGAYGIDACAHRHALAAGGFTVAVMAGGVDRLYPQGNESLLRAVVADGAVVSEVPPGGAPRRERFLSRNRLIAAMASVTVVAESGWRSGAHRTARDAAELLRPVAAFPGPVTSAASAGCHKLIREGVATLTTAGDEVRELLAPMGEAVLLDVPTGAGVLDGLKGAERQVFDSLPMVKGVAITSLVMASGLATSEVLAVLSRLENAGRVKQVGGLWRRARG
jgi:DNA processing protein